MEGMLAELFFSVLFSPSLTFPLFVRSGTQVLTLVGPIKTKQPVMLVVLASLLHMNCNCRIHVVYVQV